MNRTSVMGALLAVACATPSVEAFCDEAVPVLSRGDLGDDPAAMQEQMSDLITAAENLTPDRAKIMLNQIDALNVELDLAVRGQAQSGWSNADVVETVGSLCGEEGLVVWVVQP